MSEDNAFWNYAIEIYSRPGVSTLCLDLQDRHNCSVNRILFALWLAQLGRALPAELETREMQDWRTGMLQPIRSLRYRMKQKVGEDNSLRNCYGLLKQTELAAEKVEIDMLQRCLPECPKAEQDEALVLSNLYCSVTELTDELREKLHQLHNLVTEGSN